MLRKCAMCAHRETLLISTEKHGTSGGFARSDCFAVAEIRKGETVGNNKRHRPELDKYDVAILSALAINTRLTTVELSQKVHLSRTAVSRRIATLKRMNVLNDAGDILNYESIGFKFMFTFGTGFCTFGWFIASRISISSDADRFCG